MNKNEMMIKAAVKHEGKWPVGYSALIVSTEDNDYLGEGVYKDYALGEGEFNHVMSDFGFWQWVCTKSEFKAFMQELVDKAPEGATHYCHEGSVYIMSFDGWKKWIDGEWRIFSGGLSEKSIGPLIPLPKREHTKKIPDDATHTMIREDEDTIFLKDVDRHTLTCSVWSCGVWESNIRYFLNDNINKIRNEPEKWTPEVGQECKAYEYTARRYRKSIYIGDNPRDKDSSWKAFSGITTGQPFFSDRYKFRPLRTQEEIEREELFNECVIFLKNIPQCGEVNSHHKDAIEWLIDKGYINRSNQ